MTAAKTTARRGLREYSADATFGKAYDARLMKRLWTFVLPHKALFFVALASYPIASGLHLIQPYLIKVAIDRHLVPKVPEGFGLIVLAFIGSILFEFGARFVQAYITQLVGQRATRDLRMALFSRLQAVDVAYVERNPIGRLMTRVTNDVESLSEMFSTGAVSIVGDIVTLTGIVIMMLALDYRLTLATFGVVPILAVIILVFRRYAREAFRDVRRELARLNGALNEAISGMSLIQVFRQESTVREEFDDLNSGYRDANFRAIRFDAMTYAIVEALGTVSIAGLLLFGLGYYEHGEVKIGVFVAFIDYVRRFFGPITELSTKYTVMQSAMASAERCVDLLDEPTRIEEPESPKPLVDRVDKIRFENVSFEYRTGEPVLEELNLEINRGEKVAIVGPTGSGKSTIVKLLSRFYDVTDGKITFDGIDVREVASADLRKKLAVVLQDSYLFDGTIRENITLGRTDIDETRLLDAANRSRAKHVVDRLEAGFESGVGERGSRLSSGERQLVAFARALAFDPEILILDEATSAVDPETEALVQEGLKALIEDRTALIIAHRLSTVRSADRIVVLMNGRVVEQGSHEALIQQKGMYQRLYELQFEDLDDQ